MFFKACCYIFIKLNGEGARPLLIPHPFEKFLFRKENDNVCERNCIGTSNAKNRGPLLRFLTMEMNERGYKIKGPQ